MNCGHDIAGVSLLGTLLCWNDQSEVNELLH
jgi:metal-dependent amidase/aminoacylase/carboxypeptidase family protein